jgi:hypothetical protein
MKTVLRHPAQAVLAARDAIAKDAYALAERHPGIAAALVISAEMIASVIFAALVLYALFSSSK